MAWRARSPTVRGSKGRLAVALALLAVVAGGCGSSDSEADTESQTASSNGEVVDISGTEPVGEQLAGSVASLVECRDWNGASEEEKLATIEDVREAEDPEDPGIDVPQMTDDEAMGLFDNACEPAHAQGFRLYKIYSHAAGFLPLKRALDE